MTTGKPQTVNTLAYFETESNLIRTLLEEQSAFIDTGSISALSFFNGEYVDFSTSQSYLTRSSPVYGSVAATRYRTVAGSLRNTDNSATLILIQTIVDPDAEGIVPFILRVRSTLKRSSILNYDSSVTLSAYLNGGYCSTYDIQVRLLHQLYFVVSFALRYILIRSCYCDLFFCLYRVAGDYVRAISCDDRIHNSNRISDHRRELRQHSPTSPLDSYCGDQSLLDIRISGKTKIFTDRMLGVCERVCVCACDRCRDICRNTNHSKLNDFIRVDLI